LGHEKPTSKREQRPFSQDIDRWLFVKDFINTAIRIIARGGIMVPKKIAKAVYRLQSHILPKQSVNLHPGLRLATDAADTIVYIEAVNRFATLQIIYDDKKLEEKDLDGHISYEDLKKYVDGTITAGKIKLQQIPANWPDIQEVLNRVNAVRDPPIGILTIEDSCVSPSSLLMAAEILSALDLDEGVRVSITHEAPRSPICFHVRLEDASPPMEVTLQVMPLEPRSS
jgi:hypothetical protein